MATATAPAATAAAPTAPGGTPADGRTRARAQKKREAEHLRSLTLGPGRKGRVAAYLVVAVLAALWALPLAWAVLSSFKAEADVSAAPLKFWPDSGWTAEAYRSVLAAGDIPLWIWNSVLVSTIVTVITVTISALAAYAFSRQKFRGRKWLFGLTVAAIMVPPQILIVPLFDQMIALRLSDTLLGVALPQVVMPLMVIVMKNFFDQIPVELEEAARLDGAGDFRVFFAVVLPLSRSIITAVSIFVFISAWNNFLWPFIVTNSPEIMTIPVGLGTVKNAYGVQYASEMASAMIGALPLLIVFMLFQRHIIRGFATSGMGGQ
ncbi:carbohydrate ABC transporter permease [Arthrobacter zhaoxinii]|uniref:carbohydrate ABC transporter permease n=1 Tax=Arthrobacter zhaoxinii TaxID=2964616 RepID=UPI00210673D6|nr:carbohydrate ABC transporter permease [Arthrobacter zhaoxinii]MCQ2002064.1 carbohydrate ABC transporter permease [Arthrobacter zhaoxinii]